MFQLVSKVNGARRENVALPWLRCLEDYAFFSTNVLGADGKEDRSPGPALAAEFYNMKSNVLLYPTGIE